MMINQMEERTKMSREESEYLAKDWNAFMQMMDVFSAETSKLTSKILNPEIPATTKNFFPETRKAFAEYTVTREQLKESLFGSINKDKSGITESAEDIVDKTEEEAIRKAVEEKTCW